MLHLIRPLGFNIDEKSVRRAGLDYWPYVDLRVHDSFEDFLNEYEGRRMFLATAKGSQFYIDIEYHDEYMILFGRETTGLPRPFIEAHKDMAIRIPMSENTRLRSLNLANSATIIVYEAQRQLGCPGLA